MKCQDCKKREAIITFSSEPMYAFTHGYGKQEICRQCYIKKIEIELENIKENLKEQKKLLKQDALSQGGKG